MPQPTEQVPTDVYAIVDTKFGTLCELATRRDKLKPWLMLNNQNARYSGWRWAHDRYKIVPYRICGTKKVKDDHKAHQAAS